MRRKRETDFQFVRSNERFIPTLQGVVANADGQIRNVVTGNVLTPYLNTQRRFAVKAGGRTREIAPLVYSAWHRPCPKGNHVHHVGCDPRENRADNLECLSPDVHKQRHRVDGPCPPQKRAGRKRDARSPRHPRFKVGQKGNGEGKA